MATLSIYKGTALNTTKVPIKDGQLLFETDTKKIWLDTGTERLQVGSQDTITWDKVTSKPSYYDAKAITSITRNGTTFTYTCLDGTTGTFTQQDYSAATISADGLMTAADKTTLNNLNSLVGDTAVSEQISDAIAGIEFLTIETTDSEAGIVPSTNSDQLGGIPANEYALKTDVEEIAAASNNSVKLMSAEEFEALTTEQKIALYNEGVRVIAVDGELDPDNMTDMQRFADFTNPVGTIREFNVPTNPATLFGVGTWESYMPGRVLIGAGTADSGTVYEAGSTGGEEVHKLTKNEMPSHFHRPFHYNTTTGERIAITDGTADDESLYRKLSYTNVSGYIGGNLTTASAGDDAAHNNMQPYAVVYRWLRVA